MYISGMEASTPCASFRPGHGPASAGYRVCRTTVMDTSDPGLLFDANGDCQFVGLYRARERSEIQRGEAGRERFRSIVEGFRRRRGIDCICGVSGGVDSSLVLLRAVQAGLRPLAVHMDNGWNDELAVANIERLTQSLGVELHTVVLDWASFRDLQRSFFIASVPNVEMVTDHAINATLFRFAAKSGVRHIISGSNLATEAFLPTNSGHDNKDWLHIRGLHRRFGTERLRDYPHLTLARFAYLILAKRVRFLPVLNYLDYDRSAAKAELEEICGWRDYGRKHGESRFTRFFQEHYLPAKFGIHKRRAHLSCQILAGHITRGQAIEELSRPLWGPGEVESAVDSVCRKLGFDAQTWDAIMGSAPKSHYDYPVNRAFTSPESRMYQLFRSWATGRSTQNLGEASPNHEDLAAG